MASYYKWQACVLVFLSLLAEARAADIIIDAFEDGPLSLADSTGGPATSLTQNGLSVIGGSRLTELRLGVPGSLSAKLEVGANDDAVQIQFQQPSPNPTPPLPSDATFIYFANSELNANLVAGGNDRFRLTLTSVPDVESYALIYLYSSTTGFADIKAPIPTAGVQDIMFSSFRLQSPGFSFADVDRIDVRLFLSPAAQSASYGLAEVRVTAPEPSLIGIGIGLLLLGRRHQIGVRA